MGYIDLRLFCLVKMKITENRPKSRLDSDILTPIRTRPRLMKAIGAILFTPATDQNMANSGEKFLTGPDASDVVYPVKDGSDKKSLGKYCCVPY